MITVHHLNNSRSQRVLWLLEELGLDYQIEKYQRDAQSNLAPDALQKLHPLGKSPVLTDDDKTIIESAAIIDYVVRHYSKGRLTPAPGTDAHEEYLQWMHYSEGSAMLPLMLKMYTGRLSDGGEELQPRITSELDNHFSYLNAALDNNDWFVDNTFSAADIQLSFVIQLGPMLHSLDAYPNLADFLDRIHARPAYQKALKKGGEYAFGG